MLVRAPEGPNSGPGRTLCPGTVPEMDDRRHDTGRGLGELEVVARLRSRLSGLSGPEEVHLGDDTAVLSPGSGKVLFAADLVVEGVHFDLAIGTAADAGWKVVAANVSDVAAMGGVATHCVVGVAAAPGSDLEGLFDGLQAASAAYGIGLVGGDLSRAPVLVVCVSILGETGLGPAVLRSGAGPGDELWCTGPLGGSAAGLEGLRAGRLGPDDPLARAYLRPLARPAEGRLAAGIGASAMIDVSDGLALDATRLAEESGVGIELDEVPVAAGASEEQALGGGEDYELLFAVRAGTQVEESFEAAGLRRPVRVGTCTADATRRTLRGEPLPPLGWVHDLGAPGKGS